jgi:branched-chain amino acid transport system ATP-binding protein
VTAGGSRQAATPAGNGRGAAAGPILRTEELTMRFGGLTAVNRVSIAIERGEIRAIIGPNGAGKSTFFNCITGVLKPTSGRVILNGEDVAAQSRRHAWNMVRNRLSLPDVVDRARAVLDAVGLLPDEDELAANLSHGAQRNLEIGIALATEPELLCLDEPTAGMSVSETRSTVELVRRIAKDLTIVIVEHDMEVVMGLAKTITVLHYGEVLAEGTPAQIQANQRVQEVYLKT